MKRSKKTRKEKGLEIDPRLVVAIDAAYSAADTKAIEDVVRKVAIKILAATLKVSARDVAADATYEVMQGIAYEAVENVVKGKS